jgi:hypothetical protein
MELSDIFTKIYKENRWKDPESVSGAGSTLKYTENLRKELPTLVEKFGIKSIIDAPCGDFNWMKEILPGLNVNYIGGDIVEPLINNLNSLYANKTTNFSVLDITQDTLPSADLMICRDCLFHLHPDSVKQFFTNFLSSDIKYLLTTTHINQNNEFQNVTKLRYGDFKRIDLFSHPYSLPKNVLFRIKDYINGFPPREMILFQKNQLQNIYE